MRAQRNRQLVLVGVIALALLLAGTIWFVRGVVTWVRDLPNRVHVEIDDEQVVNAIDALAEAVRIALRDGEPKTQLETLEQLRKGIRQGPQNAEAYQKEFLAEVLDLCDANNERVADSARQLVREMESANAP